MWLLEARTARGWGCLLGRLGTPRRAGWTSSQPGQAEGRPGAQSFLSQFPARASSGTGVLSSSPIHPRTPLWASLSPSEYKGRDLMRSALGIPTSLSCSWQGCNQQQVSELPHQQGEPRPLLPPPALEGGPRGPRGQWEVGGERGLSLLGCRLGEWPQGWVREAVCEYTWLY